VDQEVVQVEMIRQFLHHKEIMVVMGQIVLLVVAVVQAEMVVVEVPVQILVV
jgi:hypothetical protein